LQLDGGRLARPAATGRYAVHEKKGKDELFAAGKHALFTFD
jgi:hypothetical protein